MAEPRRVFPPADTDLLYRISVIFNEAVTWEDGLSKALIPIRDHFVFDNAAVYLTSKETLEPVISFARAAGRGRNSEADAYWGLDKVHEIIHKSRTVLVNDVDPTETDRLRQPLILGLPLVFRNGTFGALIFIRFGTPPYTQDQIEFAEAFSDLLSNLIILSRLEDENRQIKLAVSNVQAQEDFISALSHEVRTPLGFIKGYTTTLLRTDIEWDEESRQQFLTIIDKETDNLQSFLDNLIESARMKSGRMTMKIAKVDLEDWVTAIKDFTKAHFTDAMVELELNASVDYVYFDPMRLKQVYENLISNAVKYAPGSPVKIHLHADNKVFVTVIADQGPGIPEKYQPNLFERFYRSPSNKPNQHGSGMGLYISRQIVEAHNGDISIQSEEGKGTTFVISLPSTNDAIDKQFGDLA